RERQGCSSRSSVVGPMGGQRAAGVAGELAERERILPREHPGNRRRLDPEREARLIERERAARDVRAPALAARLQPSTPAEGWRTALTVLVRFATLRTH